MQGSKSWLQAKIMTTKMFKNHPGAPFIKPFDNLKTDCFRHCGRFLF